MISFRDTLWNGQTQRLSSRLFSNSTCMTGFYSCHKTDKKIKGLYCFGGHCLKIRDVFIDFEPYFKVHNLVSVHPKSIILGQMTKLNMIFHVVASVYRLIKIWNSPQFPAEFRNGQWTTREAKERDPGNEVDWSRVIRIVRTNQVSHGIVYSKNNFLYLLVKMEIYLHALLWWMFSISRRCNRCLPYFQNKNSPN